MKKIVLSIVAMLTIAGLRAQYASEAFNYSQTDLLGTAAYVGRAGAIGALGADFTAASYNPAGLGMFYTSQVAISPSIDWACSNSKYMGVKEDDSRTVFSFTNANALFAFGTGSQNGWKAFQFGVGMNKLRSFNNRTYIEGNPVEKSLLTSWTSNANSSGLNAFTTLLAKNCGLMSYDSASRSYVDIFRGTPQLLRQSQYRVESGGINEMDISFAGNYNDKWYFGVTIGVPFLSYNSASRYTERPDDVIDSIGLDYFRFFESKNIDGTGINLKLGAIYRPIEMLRIGVAFHTPTYYELNETYSTSVESSIKDSNIYRVSTSNAAGYYYYNLSTPLKFLANAAITLGDMSSMVAGSISFDYEFTSYKTMRFHDGSNDDYIREVNQEIKDTYRSGHTFRLGGTININNFSVRAGVAYSTNPYKSDIDEDAKKLSFAGGIGYQNKNYFIDFAYAYTEQKESLYFTANPTDPISITNYKNLFVLTLGVKF